MSGREAREGASSRSAQAAPRVLRPEENSPGEPVRTEDERRYRTQRGAEIHIKREVEVKPAD